VLVNNAAIALPSGTMFQQLNECFRTNAAGPWATVEAFESILSKSSNTPRIINVTSGAGSIGLRLESNNPYYAQKASQYRVSKAALNMVFACLTAEYESKGWKILLFCPGFTESNLGPVNKVVNGAKPTSEPARYMVDMVNGVRDGDQRKFLQYDFGECQW
jgi:NAD(P)-dependent dehydrogenase (short-subunit alcohol dehydrogenase family)